MPPQLALLYSRAGQRVGLQQWYRTLIVRDHSLTFQSLGNQRWSMRVGQWMWCIWTSIKLLTRSFMVCRSRRWQHVGDLVNWIQNWLGHKDKGQRPYKVNIGIWAESWKSKLKLLSVPWAGGLRNRRTVHLNVWLESCCKREGFWYMDHWTMQLRPV